MSVICTANSITAMKQCEAMPWRAVGNSSSHFQELRGSASSAPDLTHRVLEGYQELSHGPPQAALGLCAAPGSAGHCHIVTAIAGRCQGTLTLPGYPGAERSTTADGDGRGKPSCVQSQATLGSNPISSELHVVPKAWNKQRYTKDTWASRCLC